MYITIQYQCIKMYQIVLYCLLDDKKAKQTVSYSTLNNLNKRVTAELRTDVGTILYKLFFETF